MRKALSLALLFVFGFQSSASAAVATPNAGINFGSMIATMQQSFVVMALMGQGGRYAAMHAPAPTLPRLQRDTMRPPDLRMHAAARLIRSQQGSSPIVSPDRELDGPLHIAPDPRAMSACRSMRGVKIRTSCPSPAPSSASKTMTVLHAASTTNSPAPTGINPFWTYAEKSLAGIGKAMVNVGNGNMLVQADDVDIPERGIDLAFRRTYNSMSQHDASNTDGTTPSVYGNGWTNTFDAHVSYNATTNVVSVYDIDGARYDYTSDGNGNWIAPPGQHAILQWDSDGAYLWTKKTGTFYVFMAPFAGYGWPQAKWGRLFKIRARNWNNQVRFLYTFSGDGSDPETLTQIVAAHSHGQSLTLNFAKFGNYTELYQIIRPDGVVAATYNYYADGTLCSVTRPGNAVDSASFSKTNGSLVEGYWYYSGTHLLQGVENPNYAWSSVNTPSNVYGGYYGFIYDGANRVTQIDDYASVNFTPADGFGAALQSTNAPPAGVQQWRQEYFSGWGTGRVQATDTQDHSTYWNTDSSWRVTEMQEWTGSLWLDTNYSWDADNNMTASVDPRGNETDYGYDSMGNTLWVQQPQRVTSWGTGRPVTRYTYDQFNNVLTECDANYVWQTAASTCPNASGATRYVYDYSDTIIESHGRLTDVYSPLGYHHHITYDQNVQGGDYGLPTAMSSDCMAQADGTNRCPSKTLTYDTYGNVTSYTTGNGTWNVSYDGMNRPLTHTDPDGVASYTCYNVDGSVSYTETAAQHAKDGGVGCQATPPAYADATYYDSDGNAVEMVSHKGQIVASDPVGVTKKFYDGEDRLIEVQQPHDPRRWPSSTMAWTCAYDSFSFPWTTRYLYDISGNVNGTFEGDQATTIQGVAETIHGHGNLYATQEYLPSNTYTASVTNCPTTGSFITERATNFDNLDRAVAQNEIAFGAQPKQTTTYDANGYYGLATSITNANGQTTTPSYDSVGHESLIAFSNDPAATRNRSISYDPDGHGVSVNSSFGTASYTYDADGRMTTEVEPGNDGATLTYSYYADGTKEALSVTSSALTQSNLFQYSYRTDGEEEHRTVNYGGNAYNFAWTYTNAGRELTESDPYNGRSYTVNGASPVTFGPKTYTYDTYGRVASLTLPEHFAYQNEQYDGDDEFSGFDGYDEWSSKRFTQAHLLNVRGELLETYMPWTINSNSPGVASDTTKTALNGTIATKDGNYDLRSGMLLSQDTNKFGYDASGRKTTGTSSTDDTRTVPKTNNTVDTTTYTNDSFTFDAENHISALTEAKSMTKTYINGTTGVTTTPSPTATPIPGGSTTASIGWGPDAHLRSVAWTTVSPTGSSSSYNMTIHYDGDQPLFTSDTVNGTTVYVGTSAYIDGNGLGVFDRDQSGQLVASHNANSFSAWGVASPYTIYQPNISGNDDVNYVEWAPGSLGQTGNPDNYYDVSHTSLNLQRGDGFSIAAVGPGTALGSLTFQGVRAYDSTTSQWASPDFYAGDINDPATQRPFMWNGNNPFQYSDPSGYLVSGPIILFLPGLFKDLLAIQHNIPPTIPCEGCSTSEVNFLNQRAAKINNIMRKQLNEPSIRAYAAEVRSGGVDKVAGREHMSKVPEGISGLRGQIDDINNYLRNRPNISAGAKEQLQQLSEALKNVEQQILQKISDYITHGTPK